MRDGAVCIALARHLLAIIWFMRADFGATMANMLSPARSESMRNAVYKRPGSPPRFAEAH